MSQESSTRPTVQFYRVFDNAKKLHIICEKVYECFRAGKRLIIYVPNKEAAAYVDQLLWKQPEESFIPHRIADKKVNDPVVITTDAQNLNDASVLLNLCPHVPPTWPQFEMIYDLFDNTHPAKTSLSEQRHATYNQFASSQIIE